MQNTLNLTATVQPGKRIEFSSPELSEGEVVELILMRSEPVIEAVTQLGAKGIACAADYLASLPIHHHSPEGWAEIERELREDKDTWDR